MTCWGKWDREKDQYYLHHWTLIIRGNFFWKFITKSRTNIQWRRTGLRLFPWELFICWRVAGWTAAAVIIDSSYATWLLIHVMSKLFCIYTGAMTSNSPRKYTLNSWQESNYLLLKSSPPLDYFPRSYLILYTEKYLQNCIQYWRQNDRNFPVWNDSIVFLRSRSFFGPFS